MSGQPYAVRVSAAAAKVLGALPDHAEDTAWDILTAAADNPWVFPQFDADDQEGEDVRYAAVGQLSLTYWINRHRHSLTVLNIVWLG